MTLSRNKLRRKSRKKSRRCNFKGGKKYKKKSRKYKKRSRKYKGGGCGCNASQAGGRSRRRRRTRRKSRRRKRRRKYKGGGCGCNASQEGGRRRRKHKRRLSKKLGTKILLRKMRGGTLQGSCVSRECLSPSNIGEVYTKIPYNTDPSLPDPKSFNSNIKNKGQKGGTLSQMMDDFGLGDALLSYYKGTNSAYNLKHRYKGVKREVGSDPMNQPHIIKPVKWVNTTADIPTYYDLASKIAADHTIVQ